MILLPDCSLLTYPRSFAAAHWPAILIDSPTRVSRTAVTGTSLLRVLGSERIKSPPDWFEWWLWIWQAKRWLVSIIPWVLSDKLSHRASYDLSTHRQWIGLFIRGISLFYRDLSLVIFITQDIVWVPVSVTELWTQFVRSWVPQGSILVLYFCMLITLLCARRWAGSLTWANLLLTYYELSLIVSLIFAMCWRDR